MELCDSQHYFLYIELPAGKFSVIFVLFLQLFEEIIPIWLCKL